jgi:hypothetical protein
MTKTIALRPGARRDAVSQIEAVFRNNCATIPPWFLKSRGGDEK